MFGKARPALPPNTLDLRNIPEQLKPRKNRPWKLILLVTVCIILVGGTTAGGFWVLRRQKAAGFFPQKVKDAVTFPLYYPTKIPAGFQLNQNSFGSGKQVVLYEVKKDDQNKFIVSLQPVPVNYDWNNFNHQQMIGSQEIDTSIGAATLGQFNDNLIMSIPTESTWILITAVGDINAKTLENFGKSFKVN